MKQDDRASIVAFEGKIPFSLKPTLAGNRVYKAIPTKHHDRGNEFIPKAKLTIKGNNRSP